MSVVHIIKNMLQTLALPFNSMCPPFLNDFFRPFGCQKRVSQGLEKGLMTRGYLRVGWRAYPSKKCAHFNMRLGDPLGTLEQKITLRVVKTKTTSNYFDTQKRKKIKDTKWAVHTGTTKRSVRSGC